MINCPHQQRGNVVRFPVVKFQGEFPAAVAVMAVSVRQTKCQTVVMATTCGFHLKHLIPPRAAYKVSKQLGN